MDITPSAGPALSAYATAIAGHDWRALRDLLADEATVTLLHTGERLGADEFVAFNRGYPGGWVFHTEEIVDGGGRGALRARVVMGEDTFHVATFGSADSTGRLTDLVEVWTEAVTPHPERGTS
jgi:SnoaL-like protein